VNLGEISHNVKKRLAGVYCGLSSGITTRRIIAPAPSMRAGSRLPTSRTSPALLPAERRDDHRAARIGPGPNERALVGAHPSCYLMGIEIWPDD
jgi:hypothetical protein